MRKKAVSRLMLWTLLLLASILATRFMIETEYQHYLTHHHKSVLPKAARAHA